MSGENISKHLILGGSLWDFVGWYDDDTKNLSDVTRWINRWVDIVLSNAWIPKRKPLVLSWKPKIKRINIDLAFEYVIDKNQSHGNILVFINLETGEQVDYNVSKIIEQTDNYITFLWHVSTEREREKRRKKLTK